MRIVLLGAPGAGKGTQASLLAKEGQIAHVASGDLFRNHLGEGTELGFLAKSFMDKGQLVPDEVTIKMVLERIGKNDAAGGYVLDGFPRNVAQATSLDIELANAGEKLNFAPMIVVNTDELVQRLAGRRICRQCQKPYHDVNSPAKMTGVCDVDGGELYQREDDKSEVVRTRLETFAQQTAPLIDYYEAQGKLVRVNGQQSIKEVTTELLRALNLSQVSSTG
jgi:adenylate kinase